MTSQNKRPLFYAVKLWASFQIHQWIQTRVIVWKCPIWFNIDNLLAACYFKICHHFVAIGAFKLELQSWNAQFWSKSKIFLEAWPWNLTDDLEQGKSEGFDSCGLPSNLTQIGFKLSIFRPCDLQIWWMTPKNNKACLLYYIKLCVSYQIHKWIQTGVTVRKSPMKTPNLGQIRRFLEPCDLQIWQMTLKNNRAPLVLYFKVCASFCSHWLIQT